MEPFVYKKGRLFAEGVAVEALAKRFGTPLFVYSRAHLRAQYRALTSALLPVRPLICYSVKANSNGAVIAALAAEGAGAEVVSDGELYRARRAGVPARRIVFAGVGKTEEEIDAGLRAGILFFAVESEPELERIAARARRLGRTARVALRVNPDVDPHTHHYISTGRKENKFGFDIERVRRAYERAAMLHGVEAVGLHMHLGSQILSPEPYVESLRKITPLCQDLRKQFASFRWLDLGGGMGISYRKDQRALDPKAFARAVRPLLQSLDLDVVLEPGRFLVGNAGLLVTRVQYVKEGPAKSFVIVDAGMSDLIRPPLYQAHHEIAAVQATRKTLFGDVVGPICESADFLALERELPHVAAGDLLAVRSAGAYAFSMASTYNSRPRAAEVMVSGRRAMLIRRRETVAELVRGEHRPTQT